MDFIIVTNAPHDSRLPLVWAASDLAQFAQTMAVTRGVMSQSDRPSSSILLRAITGSTELLLVRFACAGTRVEFWRMAAGIKRKEIRNGVGPKKLVTLIVGSLEGALMISRLERDREALLETQSHLERYLDSEVRLRPRGRN